MNSANLQKTHTMLSPTQHVLITAMGLHPAPVARSIHHHNPDIVIFLASLQSYALVEDIDLRQWQHHCLVIEDISNWQETYHTAQQALELALAYGTPNARPRLTIEPTFGSKIMSAGLVLACAGYGATWSYVRAHGLAEGQEQVLSFADPIATRVQEQWQDWCDVWDAARYSECERILKRILTYPLPLDLRTLYSELRHVVIGLEQWQRGHYEDALDNLEAHLNTTSQACYTWADPALQPLQDLLNALDLEHLPRLRTIVDSQRHPHTLLPDLLANMQRLAHNQRYDLAALTLRQLLHVIQALANGLEEPLVTSLNHSLHRLEADLMVLENSFIRNGIGKAQQTLFSPIEQHVLECCKQLGIEPATALPTWTSSDIL